MVMHEFVTYSDCTIVVSSDIRKKENGEEYIIVCFERPTKNGFDNIIYELHSYKIIKKDGNYSEKEIEMFKSVVERGASYFFEIAKKVDMQST